MELLNTIKRASKLILIIFIGVPICILIRLIMPFKIVRFGYIYGERIGHFAKDVELYLSERDLNQENFFDFFFIGGKPANIFFLKLIKRKLVIHKFFAILYYANKFLPNYKKHEIIVNSSKSAGLTSDTKSLLSKTKTHLKFTEAENKEAKQFLKRIGSYNKFVCLNIRDSAYLRKSFPEIDFTYHDYRDSDISNYKKAVEYLLDNDYFVIRMGKVVEKSLDINHSNFFDYAVSSLKSDFLDIWLMSNCNFCISTSNGLDEISDIFRRPISYVNALPIGNFSSWNKGCIWTPKTIVTKDDLRPLSLNELIETGLIGTPDKGHYVDLFKRNNLTYLNNTEDEILANVIEMDNILSKGIKYSEESQLRQKLFWDSLKKWNNFDKYHDVNQNDPVGRISDSYLANQKDSFFV